ncbi:hypothetical protein [Glacieibacterium sp.]|uniref:hypothetical protein n=1 Tax=Glacieibacterium sp. TaxID=2860237 RepID=UPI003B00B40A
MLASISAQAAGGPVGRAGHGPLPHAFYRSISRRYWLAAVIVGGLVWLALFELLRAAPIHP